MSCQWDKLLCLSFSPSCQSSRSLKSFSLTKVVWQTLSVMEQPLNSLFISLACSAIHTYYRKGRLAISTAGSINFKRRFQKTLSSLFVPFFLLRTLVKLLFHLIVLTPFYVFSSLAVLLVQGRYYILKNIEKMRRMLIKMSDSCYPHKTAVFVYVSHGMDLGCRHYCCEGKVQCEVSCCTNSQLCDDQRHTHCRGTGNRHNSQAAHRAK